MSRTAIWAAFVAGLLVFVVALLVATVIGFLVWLDDRQPAPPRHPPHPDHPRPGADFVTRIRLADTAAPEQPAPERREPPQPRPGPERTAPVPG